MSSKEKNSSLKVQPRKQSASDFGGSVRKLALTTGTMALAGGMGASLATVGLAQYLVSQLTKPVAYNIFDNYKFTPYEFQADFEEVQFPTVGGRLLSGWFLPRPSERRVIVASSGHRGRKEDMLGVGVDLWRNNFNVLMFDYRGYGGIVSKGDLQTLGHRELQDYLAAVSYVRRRIDGAIVGAVGASMGAAVAIVATSRDPEIRAVWADSSFATQHEVISDNFSSLTHLPAWPIIDVSERLFQWRTGHRYRHFEPVAEIGQIAPRPVYLLHGGKDSVVPVKHAYKLYEAARGPKELWIDPDAEHCGIYFANRKEYWQRVVEFFNNHLKPEAVLASSEQTHREVVAAM